MVYESFEDWIKIQVLPLKEFHLDWLRLDGEAFGSNLKEFAHFGVSAQTIYNWEAGKSRPRQQQLDAFASLRGVGKRQASAKLQELVG